MLNRLNTFPLPTKQDVARACLFWSFDLFELLCLAIFVSAIGKCAAIYISTH